MFNIRRLLEARGHEVVPFSVAYRRNVDDEWAPYFVPPIAGDDEVYFRDHTWTPRSLGRALGRTFYSQEVRRALSRLLEDARPDVALVLQYLRKMSPSILTALHDRGIPAIVRLSDFAMVCPGAHLTRDGITCTQCVGNFPWRSVRFGCVRGSRLVSAVDALAVAYQRSTHVFDLVDEFIAPTDAMRDVMMRGGWDGERVRVIPTPVAIPRSESEGPRDVFVYLGRIDRLKGVFTLADAHARVAARYGARTPKLVFVGDADGPDGRALRAHVMALGLQQHVRFAGVQDMGGIGDWLGRAVACIVPSICCDNLPNSMLEGLAAGAPIIASDQPSLREALAGSDAAILVPPGDATALGQAMGDLVDDPDRLRDMGAAARQLARERFSEDSHVVSLERLFEDMLDKRHARSPDVSCRQRESGPSAVG
jgi:glycosyltransferase involved in cell wall biosynthesis